MFRYYYCGFHSYEEDRIERLGYTCVDGVELPVLNVTSPIKSKTVHDNIVSKYKRKIAHKIQKTRPVLEWSECINFCYIMAKTLSLCAIQLKKVLEGISRNDVPPPRVPNKVFATETRGQLTGLLIIDYQCILLDFILF